MHAYHLQRFYNEKSVESFCCCCCNEMPTLCPPLSLALWKGIQEVFARIPLFFTGLISLPWQPNDSCYWAVCVCMCAGVRVCECGRWRCHRSMPAAVTLDIYLLILLILLKSAAGAEAGSYACTHPFEISCHLSLSLSVSIFLSRSLALCHLLWDIYTVDLVASSWQMNFVWLAK